MSKSSNKNIAKYMATYRQKHPDRWKARARRSYQHRMLRNRELVRAYKSTPCADCKIQYPYYVMDFDHIRGEKKFNLARYYKHTVERLLEEISKCDVVCANCHRIRTYKRKV